MPTRILVVDADVAFATMIQQVLEDLGDYRVSIVTEGGDAVAAAASTPFDLAIVDMAVGHAENTLSVTGADVVRGLRATRPSLAIIAIPADGDESDPQLAALDVQGFLTKPFFIPDLEEIVEEALSKPVSGVAPPPRAPRGARPAPAPHTPAPAARPAEPPPAWLEDVNRAAQYLTALSLETSAQAALLVRGARLIAYAGQFPREDVEELGRIVHENWTRDGGQGTLMRFIRLSNSSSDHLLYATGAVADIVLALVFQAETPLGMIRKQTKKVAEALARPPLRAEPLGPKSQGEAAGGAPPDSPRADVAAAGAALPPLGVETDDSGGAVAGETPPAADEADGWLPVAPSRPTRPPEEVRVDVGLEFPAESPAGLSRTPHALYRLTYAYVWVPKLPKSRMIGDLAARLDEWIRNLALAYDWRVERLDVRADHVALALSAAPSTAPERVVRILKRATSEKILAEFPRLAADHPAGDFWAPGYLLIGPDQHLTPQTVRDFIAYVRREQGLNRQ